MILLLIFILIHVLPGMMTILMIVVIMIITILLLLCYVVHVVVVLIVSPQLKVSDQLRSGQNVSKFWLKGVYPLFPLALRFFIQFWGSESQLAILTLFVHYWYKKIWSLLHQEQWRKKINPRLAEGSPLFSNCFVFFCFFLLFPVFFLHTSRLSYKQKSKFHEI